MKHTALFLFAVMLFITWYVHSVNRASNGTGFRVQRLKHDVAYTATVSGALLVLLVTWGVVGVYLRHVRVQHMPFASTVGPPFMRWTASCLAAFVVGVVLAELYCLADERAFARETRRAHARALRDSATREAPYYARTRWWPASGERLVSEDQLTPEQAVERAREFLVKAHADVEVDLERSVVRASDAVWRVTFPRRELVTSGDFTVVVDRHSASAHFPRDERA